MSMTLLELTQAILSSMDSDEINSISDTTESMQVANVIKTTYYDIISRAQLPEHETLFSLEASGDNDLPVKMTVPSTVNNVLWVRYDTQDVDDTTAQYRKMQPLLLEEFLNRAYSLDTTDDTVGTMSLSIGTSTLTIPHYNDRAPSTYTCYDDYTIIFDSYDSAVEDTLQKSKTVCFGQTGITWSMTDTFTPDLDERQFPLLLNEAKVLAFAELKQMEHKKANQNARRGWTSLMNSKERVSGLTPFQKLPNYGRR